MIVLDVDLNVFVSVVNLGILKMLFCFVMIILSFFKLMFLLMVIIYVLVFMLWSVLDVFLSKFVLFILFIFVVKKIIIFGIENLFFFKILVVLVVVRLIFFFLLMYCVLFKVGRSLFCGFIKFVCFLVM